jgi:hypothetical protein
MPAFEGVGGRKKKRTRKQTTSTGIQLQQSLAPEVVDAIRTSENISQEHITHDHQDHPSQLEICETYNHSTNQQETFEGQETTYDPPTDPQVDNLLAYLQTKDYKRKKLLEDPPTEKLKFHKILKYKKERVQGKDTRLYLIRYKNQSADKDEWLPENNIPDGAIHLRNYRASKRTS